MKILHTADIHLGFTAYNKMTEDRVNQRQMDIFNRFEHMVTVAIEKKVDKFLVCGDLFHRLNVPNDTLAFCLQQLLRLREAGIQVFIIGGNHDNPKTTTATSPLKVLEFLDNVICAYDGYKFVELPEVSIHMVPYIFDKEQLMAVLRGAMDNCAEDRLDILMLHVAVDTLKMLQYDEVVLESADMTLLKNYFNYIALGHYHGQWVDGDKRVVYAGSLEKLAFNEVDDTKGFVVFDDAARFEAHEIDARPMFRLPDIDLENTGDPTQDILEAIKAFTADKDITGAICRVKVKNLDALLYRALDFRELHKVTEDALSFDFIYEIKEESLDFEVEETTFESMQEEWLEFGRLKHVDEDIITLGANYIRDIED